MASNVLLDIVRIKELRDRIFFTLSMLLLYRIGTYIPVPGINVGDLMSQGSTGKSPIEVLLDFFSGGAFSNYSLFMLGVMPYISMSIIMQLVLLVFPKIKKIVEEEGGKKRYQRWIRNGTLVVCIIQGFMYYSNAISSEGIRAAIEFGPGYEFLFAICLIAASSVGTMILIWMGEQISARGIGNGVSLIIFAGIVARMPSAMLQIGEKINTGELNQLWALLVLALFIGVVILVIYEQRGQRKIPVNYAKRVVGRKMFGSSNTYIPFKINPSGVIPVIFASAILQIPMQIAQMLGPQVAWLNQVANFLNPNGVPYLVGYTILIVFFAFFYTQVSLNPIEISRQIRENGGSIPGIRSEKTEEYLTRVLNRIVLPGSLFLAFIALIPAIVMAVFNFPPAVAQLIGGTSLLIIVGVDLDLMAQIEGQLRMHHHEGFSTRGRIRGRNL
jgi:preprotein translocase subunit SecY